jgi:hypothetical protein
MQEIPLLDSLTDDHISLISDLMYLYPAIGQITGKYNEEHDLLVLTVTSGGFTFSQPTGDRALRDRENRVRRLGDALMSSIKTINSWRASLDEVK